MEYTMNGFIRRNSSLIILLIVYSIFMFIDCVFTGSPYSAWHSGKVGAFSSSTVFRFNIAYVLLVSAIIAFILKGLLIYRRNVGYLFCLIIIMSGVINGKIFTNYNTYFFDSLMIFIVSNMAYVDIAFNCDENQNEEFNLISKIIAISFVMGLLLTIFGNGKYGYLPFDFTRSSRGEVTWWVILFIPVLLCIVTVIKIIRNEKAWLYLAFSVIAIVVVLSTSSRTQVLQFIVVLLLFFISQRLSGKKLFFIALGLVLISVFGSKIWGFFTLGAENSLETILNGRYGLWQVYWEAFKSNPITGYGTDVYIDSSVGASSEIGLLKDITHYGIVFGILFVCLVVKGIGNAYRVIRNNTLFNKRDIFVAYMFFVSTVTLMQQHARILQFSDYLCWYAIFYMSKIDTNISSENIGGKDEQRV